MDSTPSTEAQERIDTMEPLPISSPSEERGGLNGKSSSSTEQKRGHQSGKNAIQRNHTSTQKHKQEDGRSEWSREPVDRRTKNEDSKRRRLNKSDGSLPVYATEFSKEEIEAEERRPKKKVAMMIGYSGTGYKGMQLNDKEKTIEGDLFKAFVLAGAVSKANANDPKKSSLVRCARTDKGVHAAGNLISMKLIVEDADIVEKINSHLPSQIRVWGFEKTKGSFNAYQLCESRIYEYLIPTHCFLPPIPRSYLGIKLVEFADEAGDRAGYEERQQEVASFWSETEETYFQPILDALEPEVREMALRVLYEGPVDDAAGAEANESKSRTEATPASSIDEVSTNQDGKEMINVTPAPTKTASDAHPPASAPPTPLVSAIKDLKSAILAAKLAYRIQPARLARVRSILDLFIGTHSFHNYTPHQSPHSSSAKRIIKSFSAAADPVIINGVEWLSLKIHGQSFMMHQIRKMVALVALIVRSGCSEARVKETLSPKRYIIPKAPGLGLLLERPVFGAYNTWVARENARAGKMATQAAPIEFARWGADIEEFKQREIYSRIWREESETHGFHTLFVSLDNRPSGELLWLSSLGIRAVEREARSLENKVETDDEGDGEEAAEEG